MAIWKYSQKYGDLRGLAVCLFEFDLFPLVLLRVEEPRIVQVLSF